MLDSFRHAQVIHAHSSPCKARRSEKSHTCYIGTWCLMCSIDFHDLMGVSLHHHFFVAGSSVVSAYSTNKFRAHIYWLRKASSLIDSSCLLFPCLLLTRSPHAFEDFTVILFLSMIQLSFYDSVTSNLWVDRLPWLLWKRRQTEAVTPEIHFWTVCDVSLTTLVHWTRKV